MKAIKILHVFPDDKFFDGVSDFYDSLDGVANLYYYYSRKRVKFKYIKSISKVVVTNNLISYLKLFSRKDIDMILFHSLPTPSYFYFPFINRSKVVIWWAWGYDIYNDSQYLPSLLRIPLYKQITKLLYTKDHKKRNIFARFLIVSPFLTIFLKQMREYAISRIDFMIPVLPIDYKLLKERNPYFKAKPLINGESSQDFVFEYKKSISNILVGNSLTYSNNHLDIFEILYSLSLDNRKYVIPISYGDAYGGADNLIKLSHFKGDEVIWLKNYLSASDFFFILKNISHAIFGIIRQQAMGNIYYCLRTGIKVFLYKDSIVYQQLMEWGFIVYSIEEDLNEKSLSEVLPKPLAKYNFDLYRKIREERSPGLLLEQLCNIAERRQLGNRK